MAVFKCISCGELKENDKSCSCPVCGYKMYETPYDRKEVLRREIGAFVNYHTLTEISIDSFYLFRKAPKNKIAADLSEEEKYTVIPKKEDDKRFPDFSKIQDYVCASSKTETFIERINTSIEQIRKHIREPYAQTYEVSLDAVGQRIAALDEILRKAMEEIGVEADLPEAELPELTLDYSETPDDELLDIAEALLDDLSALASKILKFIKQNNIYGSAYKEKPQSGFILSKDGNYAEDLFQCRKRISKILAKHYVVDIFSDGSDELREMLGAFWNAMEAVMTVPVLTKQSIYIFRDGEYATEDEIGLKLLNRIDGRYAAIDEVIYADDFLTDRSEEQLFDIYDKMIALDSFGFMGVKKDGLLKIGESEKKLNELIGLNEIKESIKKIKAYALSNKESEDLNIHMCFLGNPGSGKTEVARYIAGILYENKILPTNKVIEVDRSGLVSQYFGATAEKTSMVIQRAMGGVLFIDEAYALGNNNDAGSITDYGKEAIDTLVKAMEDYRGKFCVILAGYRNEMLRMLSTNPGFKSRIQFTLDFPNYSREELKSIAEMMLKNRKYTIGEAAMNRILDITDVKRKEPDFANAREIRNILDQVIMCQNVRCAGTGEKELGLIDVNKYIKDANLNLPTSGEGSEKRILTGDEELDRLAGLASVKKTIRKIRAYAKKNKADSDFNLHMCFYGNPGTGKTEVARILSRILYDAGVLDEAKLVETDAHGLLGSYVGQTAPKTRAKIDEAMGGVLFIDEAYALADSNQAGGNAAYGEEAISVLLKEMEDRRGRICIILAGYKKEMRNLLEANPGFESRIQFTLEFPDYDRDELGEIAESFLAKKKYSIEKDALERILDTAEYFRKRPNFANARTVRNILDQVLMNQNLRTEDSDNDSTVILEDVEDYLADAGIDLEKTKPGTGRIGFL